MGKDGGSLSHLSFSFLFAPKGSARENYKIWGMKDKKEAAAAGG